jgi:outer membrane protein TolC
VAAANAQMGAARAAYFPQFVFSGSGGYNSVHSNNWIAAPSLFWSVGPQITLPLFEGGRFVVPATVGQRLRLRLLRPTA